MKVFNYKVSHKISEDSNIILYKTFESGAEVTDYIVSLGTYTAVDNEVPSVDSVKSLLGIKKKQRKIYIPPNLDFKIKAIIDWDYFFFGDGAWIPLSLIYVFIFIFIVKTLMNVGTFYLIIV